MSEETVAPAPPDSKRVTSQAFSLHLAVFSLVAILFIAFRFWKISAYSIGGWGSVLAGFKTLDEIVEG